MKPLVTIVLVITTFIFIIIGGIIMHFLESDNEITTLSDVSLGLDAAVQQFLCMTQPLIR